MLELVQLRQSLLQTLENYQRCGVTRVPRVLAETLPAEMLATIAELRSHGSTRSAPVNDGTTASPAVALRSAKPSTSLVPTTSTRVEQLIAPSTSSTSAQPTESDIVADRPWSIPSLSLPDRAAHFEVLNNEVKSCRKCSDIVCFRQQTVFGQGPLQPTVCFIGEAPGADEDKSGVPFVGRAGQLLTKIIEAMQLKRTDVFILNALKCRPPQNRTPVPEEIENCHPYAEAQLEILQPKYIVCLGSVAVRSLLGLTLPVGSLRGRFHQYRQARVVVTYHPSYLLRNESAKKLVWQDMQMLMHELGLKAPGKP